jgi:hypothetical protein
MSEATKPPAGRAATYSDKSIVLGRILRAWQRHPEMRLGQLLFNAACPFDIFYIEDETLANAVEGFSEAPKHEG